MRLFGLSQKHRAGSGIVAKVLTTTPASANKLLLAYLGTRGLSRTQRILELSSTLIGREKLLKPRIVTPVIYDKDIPLS